MIASTTDHASRAIASFTALHCPDGTLSRSADVDDYSENGDAIVANLREIAELIKLAARVVH